MAIDLESFCGRAAEARSPDALRRIAARTLEQAGFKAFMFSAMAAGGADPFGACDRAMMATYHAQRLYLFDPVRRALAASWLPIAWETREHIGTATPQSALLREMSLAAGYERGISTAIRGPRGQIRSLVAIWRDDATSFRAANTGLQRDLMILAPHLAAARDRLDDTADRDAAIPSQPPSLTERELECLHWTAQGKTAWEVARIIAVSERTVNFHIQKLLRKLDASSKHQALRNAAALGLIAA